MESTKDLEEIIEKIATNNDNLPEGIDKNIIYEAVLSSDTIKDRHNYLTKLVRIGITHLANYISANKHKRKYDLVEIIEKLLFINEYQIPKNIYLKKYNEATAKNINDHLEILKTLIGYLGRLKEVESKEIKKIKKEYLIKGIKSAESAIKLAEKNKTINFAKLNYANFTRRLCSIIRNKTYIKESIRYLKSIINNHKYSNEKDSFNAYSNLGFFIKKKSQDRKKLPYEPRRSKPKERYNRSKTKFSQAEFF